MRQFMKYILILTVLMTSGTFASEFDDTVALANQGDATAQLKFGNMYMIGEGIPKNEVEAVKWFRKAADQGIVEAEFNLGLSYSLGEGVPQSAVEAIKWFRKAAEHGNPEAQYALGNIYSSGAGIPERDAEAVDWYRKAADQGYTDAQVRLGLMYASGEGLRQNNISALAWWSVAKTLGNETAENNLDILTSEMTKQELSESQALAIKCYETDYKDCSAFIRSIDLPSEFDEMKVLAEQGNITAQFNMGVSYDFARGVVENDSEAASWYLKAANQGFADAQYNLGVLYRQGSGVSQSDEEALKWYLRSGQQGNANAQTNLGFMYSNGLGVSVQDIEAIRWYRLAAMQGVSAAQSNLGVIYATGKGVPVNYTQAYIWWSMAHKQGDIDAANDIEILKSRMSRQKIAENEALATKCFESGYSECDENLEQATSSKLPDIVSSIEKSTTIDNTLALMDKQQAEALEDFARMDKGVKSSQGIRFVALIKMQNEIGKMTLSNARSMREESQFIENFNWDTDSPEEWELLDSQLETLCPKLLENNSRFSELSKILDEKVVLAKHPNVITELFGGDAQKAAVTEQFRDSQKRIMDDEKEGYEIFCTDQ